MEETREEEMRERRRIDKERLVARSLQLLPVALLAVLVVHFAFTAMYLAPLSWIKLRTQPVVDAYMEPFFGQGWTLFAPGVGAQTRNTLISCRLVDEQGNIQETPWLNVSSPYQELKRRYRLTPADRLNRALRSPGELLYSAGNPLSDSILEHRDEDGELEEAAAAIEEMREMDTELAERLLARLASAHCDRFYGVGRTREVRARIATVEAPPFSRRHQPIDPRNASYFEMKWRPYEPVSPL